MNHSKNGTAKNEPTGRDHHASSFVFIASAISALGGFLFGYDTGVISGAILFIREDFALSPGHVEFVISCVLIGALLGAMGGGVLADCFGRRRVIMATAVVFVTRAPPTRIQIQTMPQDGTLA